MSDSLNIVDLNYYEDLAISESGNTRIEGGYVSTNAYTSAGSGSALAYGDATAFGQQTSTDTNAVISTQNYSTSTSTYTMATATAYANDNGINEKSSYKSTSIYYSG
jgi:hypothetical protein